MPTAADLCVQITEMTEDILFYSESEAPYRLALWDATLQGPLTLEALLREFGILKAVPLEEFTVGLAADTTVPWLASERNNSERAQEILAAYGIMCAHIAPYSQNLEAFYVLHEDPDCDWLYNLGGPDLANLYLVTGQTPQGIWFGLSCFTSDPTDLRSLSPGAGFFSRAFDPALIADPLLAKNEEVGKLLTALQQGSQEAGLHYVHHHLGEREYSPWVWAIAQDRETLIQDLLKANGFIHTANDQPCLDAPADYLMQTIEEWDDPEEVAQRQAVAKVLAHQLQFLTLWRIGPTRIGIYVYGQAADGNWIVISTAAVET